MAERGRNSLFLPDDAVVPAHYMAMLLSGPFSWEWKDGRRFKRHTMRTGEIWVNPAHTPFSHRITEYSQFALVTLAPEAAGQIHAQLLGSPHPSLAMRHNSQDKALGEIILGLLDVSENPTPSSGLRAAELSIALWSALVKGYSREKRGESCGGPIMGIKRMERVVELIESRMTGELALADMAGAAEMSKYHFIRSFKKSFGVTPHRYLMNRLVERGALLLRLGKTPISQVSAHLGFADQSHFTRLFKRRFSATPAEYARRATQ
jgi:AraC family transcriptional regulator